MPLYRQPYKRVNLDSMARDTQHAMGQIGDSQSKECSTDKGSTAEGEIFHELNMPLWNAKTTQLRKKETRRNEPHASVFKRARRKLAQDR
jgi:hypothetical protein